MADKKKIDECFWCFIIVLTVAIIGVVIVIHAAFPGNLQETDPSEFYLSEKSTLKQMIAEDEAVTMQALSEKVSTLFEKSATLKDISAE